MHPDNPESPSGPPRNPNTPGPGTLVAAPDDGSCLDAVQLDQLEQSFRGWAAASSRPDVALSRRRILFIFLLIRSTGAKLHEILGLDPCTAIDPAGRRLTLGEGENRREVPLPEPLVRELAAALADPPFRALLARGFAVDPAFVRRKFYERAESCGFPRRLGGPECIRRARAVELMQTSMPLPAVQRLLGHASPKPTSAYVSFAPDELERVTDYFLAREAERKTSARNRFFGKVTTVERGDIQSLVRLVTPAGHALVAVITNDSVDRLGLTAGRLLTAEVKAPWVVLTRSDGQPASSAENQFHGAITGIRRGRVSSEIAVRIDEGTELCAIVSTAGWRQLGLKERDQVRVLFNCFAVILHAD